MRLGILVEEPIAGEQFSQKKNGLWMSRSSPMSGSPKTLGLNVGINSTNNKTFQAAKQLKNIET